MDKKLLTIAALVGFVSISVFGIFLMPYDGSAHDRSCLASLINHAASPCPQDDPLGFANFHNNALKKISSLTVVDSMTVMAMAIILAISLFSLISNRAISGKLSNSFIFYTLERQFFTYKASPQLAWFSLHENSPSFS